MVLRPSWLEKRIIIAPENGQNTAIRIRTDGLLFLLMGDREPVLIKLYNWRSRLPAGEKVEPMKTDGCKGELEKRGGIEDVDSKPHAMLIGGLVAAKPPVTSP